MDKDNLIAGLGALRIQVEAIGAQLDAVLSLLCSEDAETCTHESRVDTSTMGHISWVCKDCGYVHEEVT